MADTGASQAFDTLHPKIQRWVWRQGWETLRPTQEQAIPAILAQDRDVIVSAATAGGKTEAAFLPILSRMLADDNEPETGMLALYIAPLKALINDQYQRLELMTDGLDVPLIAWHGDVGQKHKSHFLKNAHGILLITPESLESIFVNHGPQVPWLFERLQYIIVDELHAFIGVERGMQLQSLMHRTELAIRQRIPRVGLSATLGTLSLAAEFLRPGGGRNVETIASTEDSGALKLQIRGYKHIPPALESMQLEPDRERREYIEPENTEGPQSDELDIAQHLFQTLRGSNNLIFANARSNVETYADLLRRQCERLRVPTEFFPHHGSLSKELREYVEDDLKAQRRPITAVCTSTLEMGIDIGSVASIAQIGPPHQVSSMRQRLGRSGRRGEAAVLRIYIQEREINDKTPPPDRLRPALFQAVAMTELLLEGWTEPPRLGALHLSTLIQQILSVIAQNGGATAKSLWNTLCKNAPFAALDRNNFTTLLRQMGQTKLLMQAHDGFLLHGELGERIVNHYGFYTAFTTPEEFTLAVEGKILGTLPVDRPVTEGSFLIFGGRRWRVLRLDMEHKRIDLARASGGRAPKFDGTPGIVHGDVRAKMLDLYGGAEVPVYLNTPAKELFQEGRRHFQELGLVRTALLKNKNDTLIFPWAGDIAMDTLGLMLTRKGNEVQRENLCLVAKNVDPANVHTKLEEIAGESSLAAYQLAEIVENKEMEKYDSFLNEHLLSLDWTSKRVDIEAATQVIHRLTTHVNNKQCTAT